MTSKIFIAASLAVLCLFNVSIYQKEQIRQNGDTVLLELAPVDPRSLMQGDYMRLRYKAAAALPQDSSLPAHGQLVIAVDHDRVGSYRRVDNNAPLQSSEKKMKYGRTGIVPDSFLFQEGQADTYRRAKYGVFKFEGPDNYILVGLADENRKPLAAPVTP